MQQLDIFTGETKLDKAIAFLQEHEPEEGYFLGFSGGKDSVLLKHLADLSGVKYQAYYSATGIDPPEVVKFIREHHPDVIFKYPNFKGHRSFFGMIPLKGYPTRLNRWCCDPLKKDPTKDIPLLHRLMGIRAEESAKRALRPPVDNLGNWTIYKPIFSWLEWELWEHIEKYNLPYCSLYDEGFDRIGCVVCPFICHGIRGKLKQHMERWPKMYVAFEKSMKRLWNDETWHEKHRAKLPSTFDEFMLNWYNGR